MSTGPAAGDPRRQEVGRVPLVALACLLVAGCLDDGGSGRPGGWVYGDAFPAVIDPRADGGASEREARDPDAPPVDGGPEAWAGTWTFESGSSGLACPDSISIVASSGTLAIAPSASGDTLTVQEDGCSFHFTLAGDTATLDPGQVCSAWAVQIPMWSLTLKPDGTIEEILSGQVLVQGQLCMMSGKSRLVRN
jgi:hypothetical protein